MTWRPAAQTLLLAALGLGAACGRGGRPDVPADNPRLAPDDPERTRVMTFWARYRTATDLRIAGTWAAAADAYASALELDPNHGDALYYLGAMRLALGDYPGAEQAWRRLIEVEPPSARGHSQLGGLFLCLDEGAPFQLDSAEAHFHRAHEINREETGALLRLGEAALVRGDPGSARTYFRQVLGSHQASAAAHFYGGYLAWKDGDAAGAAAAYQAATDAAAPVAAPASAPAGEGDTRAGRPMTAHRARCDQLQRLMDEMDAAPGMAERYARLDRLLREASRRGASDRR